MIFNIPSRQIFLEDAISREKTGQSPIKAKQSQATKFFWLKRLTYLSCCGLAVSCYMTIAKRYTNRKVYLSLFIGSLLSILVFKSLLDKYKTKLIKEFNCDEKNFGELVWFYHYALLDHENIYEAPKGSY